MKKVVSILLTLAMMATMMSAVFATMPSIGTASVPSGMSSATSKILGALQWIGYAFALGMLVFIGIKYVMSAANEKADLKKGLINFVIGAVIIAGAATICGWLADLGKSL